MTRVTYQMNTGGIDDIVLEQSIYYNDIRFSKKMYKDFMDFATWVIKMRKDVKSVELIMDNDHSDILLGLDSLVSVDRTDNFVIVYMKNRGGYDYQITRTFFID